MEKQFYELTNPQKTIWYTEKFFENTPINNICGVLRINGAVEFDILEKALNIFVENNDGFRLRILLKKDSPFQYVENFHSFDVPLDLLDTDEDLKELEKNFSCETFNVIDSPLFKFRIFKFKNGTGGFMALMHHLISDAWSSGLLINQVMDIYTSLINNSPITINHSSYIDYINSEKEYLQSEKFKKDEEFWLEQFPSIPDIAAIPSFKNNAPSSVSSRKQFVLDLDLLNSINQICINNKISMYNFLLAVFSLYIGKVSRLNEFVIGSPILNRSNFKEKHTTGMFISTVPFKVELDEKVDFISFAQVIAKQAFSIFRHQKYPYEYLLENLRKENSSVPSLYDIIISYQNMRSNTQNSNIDFSSYWMPTNNISTGLNIHFFDVNDSGKLDVAYDFQLSKYDEKDIDNIHTRFIEIINQIIKNNSILIKDIQIITDDEKNTILNTFNDTITDYPKTKNIVQLFEEQVLKTPNNIATFLDGNTLTYSELNQKSNCLAKVLQDLGVNNGDIVCILLDKSVEMIVSILAILKAGAAYLPIDVDYPSERIDYIVKDSKAKVCISMHSVLANKNLPNVLYIDDTNFNTESNNLNLQIKPNDLAYVMYTSGSTGNPKGVMINHQNVVRLVKNTNFIEFQNKEKILQTGSIVFDACTFEIWGALLNGFELYIIKKEDLLNPDELEKYLVKNKISIMWLTSPLFNQLCEKNPKMFSQVRCLLTGGDVLSPKHINKAKDACPNLTIINGYGPTENTTFSTCFTIDKRYKKSIPIGKPISNSTCYIVDNNLQLCPIGVPGELAVGGDGVGLGYLNNPNLTKEKFVKNPFGDGTLYKTGDLAMWLPNGNIEFIGRIDNQVKIRGFRIELGEITQTISTYPGIKDCVTIVHTINGEKTICSYFASDRKVSVSDLRAYLKYTLPTYMIPACFMQLDKLPINTNGKIDKKLLPLPTDIDSPREIVAPRNNIDTNLIKILKELLHISNISITDSFFDLGGDSLSAINYCSEISSALNVKVNLKDIMDNPIISELSDLISTKNNTEMTSIPKLVELKDYYPLSSAQKRIYYASNIAGKDSTLYNIPGGLIIEGFVDLTKLNNCFQELIKRHECLRTNFEIIEGNVVQKVLPSVNFNLEIKKSTTDNIDSIFSNFIEPFDLSQAPLFRACAYNLPNKNTFLLVDMHHIISDGTSLGIIISELCDLYNNLSLPSLPLSYKDFAVLENNKISSGEFEDGKKFWLKQFEDDIPLLNLPTQNIRPSFQNFSGKKTYGKLDESITGKINVICKALNITPYMFLLGAYYILLARYSDQDDIVIGSPIIGRDNKELSNIVGMFVNTLALRNKINQNETIKDFLLNIKNNCTASFRHQTYPFDELVKNLDVTRDPSRNPLFDVLFTYQNFGNPKVNLSDSVEYYIPDTNIAKFDLSLEVVPNENYLDYSFEYCTALFDDWFIKNLSTHYKNIVTYMLENIDSKIVLIDMLSTDEKKQIVDDFNDNQLSYPRTKTIIDIFEEKVNLYPNNIAVSYKDEKISYKELNKKANQFANYLIANGISNNNVVGVNLERNIDLIVCMLGIIKAGGIYMPISTDYPHDRIDYILQDSNAKILITNSNNNYTTESCKILNIDELDYQNYSNKNLEKEISTLDTLYIIYTSGSTGKPKGVEILNKNLNNCIHAFNSAFKNVSSNDVLLASTNISFDVCIWEFFFTLLNGATLCLYTENTITDIFQYCNALITNKITLAYIPPNILEEVYEILTTYENSYLQNILIGVEPIKFKTMMKYQKLNPNITIINGYGPTETTICTTLYNVSNNTGSEIIPIGKPLSNNNILILDKSLNIVPIGVTGQIYVLGENVGKGYLNKPDLTANSFVTLPNYDTIAYKTGDLAKWNKDGVIEFVGRQDNQIKINGHRVELAEIEKTISLYPHINKCVTLYKKGQLYSYFTSNDVINISDLRIFLQSKLPSFFVPNFLIQIDNFKLTANGKIDKKYLDTIKVENTNKLVPPQNNFQKTLLDLWIQFLDTDEIGITDNFFELGGDSLIAIKLQIEAFKLGLNISYSDIFEFPTIEQLSKKVEIKTKKETETVYDYTHINKLLKNNSINNLKDLPNQDISQVSTNVLLTGSTGFVGSHILDYIIANTNCRVYCLIRKKNGILPEERLLNVLKFYFDKNYNDLLNNRIFIIDGDITKPNFGLSDTDYNNLGEKVSHVINSAAIVKHYGNAQIFDETNINGVKNLISFCESFSVKFSHISTTSVSGNIFKEDDIKNKVFNEKNLFINQDLSNIYVYTKFMAERVILEHVINNNLQAKIIRLGNITNRYSDGVFQVNISENAFINRIKTFITLAKFPIDYLKEHLEFTPVDLCAEAICKLSLNNIIPNTNNVFHVYNNNYIEIKQLLEYLENLNIHIDLINLDELNKQIEDISNDANKNSILSGIITDISDGKLIYKNELKLNNNFSNVVLEKLGFKWPEIDENYITKYILYLKSIKFI